MAEISRKLNLLSDCMGLREEVQERAEKLEAIVKTLKEGVERVSERAQEHHLNFPRKLAVAEARIDSVIEEV